MPKYHYEYSIDKETDFFIVNHSISMNKLETFYDLFSYFKENKNKVWNSREEKLELTDEEIDFFLSDKFKDIKLIKLITTPNMQFKGSGWFSANSNTMKYQGKNKKLYEKLRNERSHRKSRNVSVADIDKELGLNSRAIDGIIPDKKWDKLTKEQKNIATEYGLRPSKNYIK